MWECGCSVNNLAGALSEGGQLGYAIEMVAEAVMLIRDEYAQRPDFFVHLLCDSTSLAARIFSGRSSRRPISRFRYDWCVSSAW